MLKLTTPSEEESSKPRKAGIAGGVVLMSRGPGNQSFLDGELPWTDDKCLPPLVPSLGLPRLTLRPVFKQITNGIDSVSWFEFFRRRYPWTIDRKINNEKIMKTRDEEKSVVLRVCRGRWNEINFQCGKKCSKDEKGRWGKMESDFEHRESARNRKGWKFTRTLKLNCSPIRMTMIEELKRIRYKKNIHSLRNNLQ